MERNKKVRMDMKAVAEKVKEHYPDIVPPDARFKGFDYDKKTGKATFEFEHQTYDLAKSAPVVDKGDQGSEKVSKSTSKSKKKK